MSRYLGRLFLFLLGAMFVFSGAVKLWDPAVFARQIAGYQILPAGLVAVVAAGLPVFEVITGTWLATGWKPRPPLLAANLMLIVFSAALISVLVRGLEIECGCFGTSVLDRPGMALGRDLLLLAGAIPFYLRNLRNLQTRE